MFVDFLLNFGHQLTEIARPCGGADFAVADQRRLVEPLIAEWPALPAVAALVAVWQPADSSSFLASMSVRFERVTGMPRYNLFLLVVWIPEPPSISLPRSRISVSHVDPVEAVERPVQAG